MFPVDMNETIIKLSNGEEFPRKKFSKYTKEELTKIIGLCKNYSDIITTLKLNRYYHRILKKFVTENNLNISHFKRGEATTRKIEDCMVKNSINLNSACIKNYLFNKCGVLNQCIICKQQPIWLGKPLTLTLDHINGDHYDNRIENLRILCPHCHSQTDTYTGRNTRFHSEKNCSDCSKVIKNESTTLKCAECIKKTRSICTQCKNAPRKSKKITKCNDCYKKVIEFKECKYCKETIKRQTNLTDYHKKCYLKYCKKL
jgi:hypothetical protein